MRRRRGFSLVELMVVLAIISMLMAMLLPGLSVARRKARGAACLSNLRQIGMVMHDYRADNDDWIPAVLARGPVRPAEKGGTFGLIDTAYAQVVSSEEAYSFSHYCRDKGILTCPAMSGSTGVSYGRNGRVRVNRFRGIDNPSEIPVCFDGAKELGFTYADVDTRHIGSANFLYADGHVKSMACSPMAMYGSTLLPGAPEGCDFTISIRILTTRWDKVLISITEDDRQVAGATVTRDPMAIQGTIADLGLLFLDPTKRTYKLRMTIDSPGRWDSAWVFMKVNGGAWQWLGVVNRGAPVSTANITQILRNAM